MSGVTLRYYQRELVDAVWRDWAAGEKRVAVELPTGGGKTKTFAHIAERLRERGGRTLVLAHREELVDQGIDDLREAMAPGARVGRMQGAVKQTVGVDACMAMVQTAATPGGLRAIARGAFTSMIIDECHHSAASTYRRVLDALPDAYVLGVSATLARSDRLALGDVFSKISYVKPITEMIREGWLVRPRGRHVFIKGLDLSRVSRRGGDYADGALARAMMESLAPEAIVRAWQEHAKGRRTIGFAPTVEMAYLLAETFRKAGVPSRAVHGDQTAQGRAERRAAMAAIRSGEIEVLWNVGVATEGFDVPEVSCVVMARPTSSAVLFTQCVGRGLRLHPGKTDCIVLDVVGVLGRHRLASLASLDGAAAPEATPDDLLEYEDDFGMEEDEPEPAEPRPMIQPEFVDGALSWAEIELFEESEINWLRTEGGTPFIRFGKADYPEAIFPVVRADGRVLLAVTPVKYAGGRWAGEPDGYEDVTAAMAAAEKQIVKSQWVRREAAWRHDTCITRSLQDRADEWGLKVSPGMTRGDVEDALSVRMATLRIDHLPMVKEGFK